ncbi:PIN domain-containing protein [Comamonas sp. F1-6]|uniref:PIN domain-containing protein n=1 Tax=Comamonas sp. F1-6 TaxID=673550 RepID=UPI0031DFC08C
MNQPLDPDAIVIDTSIYIANGLKLEKGLLGKLSQLKKSDVDFLIPDVVYGELKTHLEQKIKSSHSALEKAINDAGDHLYFEVGATEAIKSLIPNKNDIEALAEKRLKAFVEATGAEIFECGQYVSVTSLLQKYFANHAPFSETGKKKSEFPDAIVLMAIDSWASQEGFKVIAVTKDDDWKNYCEASDNLICLDDLSEVLAILNRKSAPEEFIERLETELNSGKAQSFLDGIGLQLKTALDGFTPDQEADSFLQWEPDGAEAWFKGFSLVSNELKVIESEEDYLVIEAIASITVEAEGDFSLSVHDSIDGDDVPMGGVTANTTETFISPILITIYGDLYGKTSDLEVAEVEIVSPITTINFGTLEPDFGDYE